MPRKKKIAEPVRPPPGLTANAKKLLICLGLIVSIAAVYAQVNSFGFFCDDDSQYLINDQNFRLEMGRDGEGQADHHAA